MTIHPAWFAAGGLCAASGIFAWGAVAPSSQLFGPTIRRLNDPSAIAITFDDGPNPAITPQILDLFDRHSAKATFFLIGSHVRAFPALAKEIAARGHAIGNHTETHPALTFLSPAQIAEQLDHCDEAILAATGTKPKWMRPPFGYRSPWLAGIVRRRGGAGVAMWSKAARDWRLQQSALVIRALAPRPRWRHPPAARWRSSRAAGRPPTRPASSRTLAPALERCRPAFREIGRHAL